MGEIISLGIGNFELSWGKNNIFTDYSHLYIDENLKKIKYYYTDGDELSIEEKDGYSVTLENLKKRLNLLGFTLNGIKKLYNKEFGEYHKYSDEKLLSFDEFYEIFSSVDLNQLNCFKDEDDNFNDDENSYDLGEYAYSVIFSEASIVSYLKKFSVQITKYNGVFYENLPTEIILRVLCDNDSGSKLEVQWRVADVIEGQYVTEDDVKPKLSDLNKITLITEGSTDSDILKKSIEYLYPEISDFFVFIDMQKNYPFTGTGNLCNFAAGLTMLNVQNKVVFIFDNDSAGLCSYDKCVNKYDKTKQIIYYHLPDLYDMQKARTIGPSGENVENINGKAIAIECFLDLDFDDKIKPIFRWENYVEQRKTYQGALENKDEYTKIFHKNYKKSNYNFSKLKLLIDDLVNFISESYSIWLR